MTSPAKRILLVLLLTLSAVPLSAPGHEGTAASADISVDEKLGAVVPAGIALRDESGKIVDLRAFADRPTIIAPIYFNCMHVCPLLLNGLADVLGKMDLVSPGKDFRVVALSFDDHDTPTIAREKKRNYLKAVGKPFPEADWTFLTGDEVNIRKFTDAIGFRFQRDGMHFSHPVVLVVLAPGGRIVRYLYGTTFLPFEVTMAVTEAAQGRIGSTRRVLQYCFSYDPDQHSYVFNILKVTGTVMVLFVGSFLVYLLKTSKRKDAA